MLFQELQTTWTLENPICPKKKDLEHLSLIIAPLSEN